MVDADVVVQRPRDEPLGVGARYPRSRLVEFVAPMPKVRVEQPFRDFAGTVG
jgi:hypothetical protein